MLIFLLIYYKYIPQFLVYVKERKKRRKIGDILLLGIMGDVGRFVRLFTFLPQKGVLGT